MFSKEKHLLNARNPKGKNLLFIFLLLTFLLSGCMAGQTPDELPEDSNTVVAVSEEPEEGDSGPSRGDAATNQISDSTDTQGGPQNPLLNTNPDSPAEYETDTVPAGKPQPVEPKKADVDKKEELQCTLTVSVKTILDNMDKLDPAKKEVLPKDGILISQKTVVFFKGESVFDVLLRAVKDQKMHMEFTSVPVYDSRYIEGIGNLYEYDCGELSGWMYKVNDWFPNYGSSRYQLEDGDQIEWLYTCDLGRDIGGDWEAQNRRE